MTEPLTLRTYEDWKHCVTVLCGIPLTLAYVDARLAALADPRDHGTHRFVQVWGPAHLERVRSWFARARTELAHVTTPQGPRP